MNYGPQLDSRLKFLKKRLDEIRFRLSDAGDNGNVVLALSECQHLISEYQGLYELAMDTANHVDLLETRNADCWEMITEYRNQIADLQEAVQYLSEQVMGVREPDGDENDVGFDDSDD